MSKALFFFFFSHIWYSHFITFFPLPRPHYRPQLLLRKEERTLNQTLQGRCRGVVKLGPRKFP
ncbi:hypothetical protein RHMOL_Rhmol13G0098800 [Rhododendron molle]|uniref:Uncharacterized protein n=1 Tax=Rhododendron molle TaxID=49168 RepID=A0ACC0L5F2_RHOML|nr:hypothetical protein RHMOL_Rhmol13G0098800 [Rhododendron molle]